MRSTISVSSSELRSNALLDDHDHTEGARLHVYPVSQRIRSGPDPLLVEYLPPSE